MWLLALTLGAGTTWHTSHRSHAEIMPAPDGQPCVAEVQIRNFLTDSARAASGFLVLGDLVVGIEYHLNVGPLGEERYVISAPEGYTAVPRDFTVADNETGSSMICPYVGF